MSVKWVGNKIENRLYMKLKEYKIYYSGRVHGVGFRFAARDLSRHFKGLTGYVKNMQDGRVEVVAECNEDTFEKFTDEIQNSFLGRCVEGVQYEFRAIEKRKYKVFDINV